MIADNISAADAVDQEFVYVFWVCLIWESEKVLMEGRERFKNVPGRRTIHAGRVWTQTEPRVLDSWPKQWFWDV